LVPVRRAGRGAEDQESGCLREEPHDLAGLADRLQLHRQGHRRKGALSTYEKLGFVRDRKIGKHRWVVTKVVEPTS
jgi:hypothetical protein